MSFKRILKYGIYIFIGGWMFVLGIMVGRGNSPVNFDTQGFQKRLESIANEFGQKHEAEKEVDLEFFKVLDQPPAEEKPLPVVSVPKTARPEERIKPEHKPSAPSVKTSTKKKTLQKKDLPAKTNTVAAAKTQKASKPRKKGIYTIQLAAYRNFKDAVSHMALLDKKGISSYKQKSTKDGVVWYRIRTGSFATVEAARKYKEQLAKKKINAMIIKKDTR